MAVTLQDLFTDPAQFLFEFDRDDAIFQAMTREDFARSTFLDGRIRHGGRPAMRVPLGRLFEEQDAGDYPAPPVCWIFHVAQCGSTLLARALDLPGRALVLREPAALRRLGVMAGAGSAISAQVERRLDLAIALLGKRWPEEAATIVKANVPVNFIARNLLARYPQSPAILLHFPLANYVAAILRTEGHVRWTEGVFDEMRLAESPWCVGAQPRSAAEKAAALWFAQMKIFEGLLDEFPATHSLDATELFDRPAETVEAAARIFGVDLAPGEAQHIAHGELFHSYSKNPALDYDPEVRLARQAEAKRRLEHEIAQAHEWAVTARTRHGLGEALARPLVGDGAGLLT